MFPFSVAITPKFYVVVARRQSITRVSSPTLSAINVDIGTYRVGIDDKHAFCYNLARRRVIVIAASQKNNNNCGDNQRQAHQSIAYKKLYLRASFFIGV